MLGINTPIGSGFSPNTLYSLSCFHNKELTPFQWVLLSNKYKIWYKVSSLVRQRQKDSIWYPMRSLVRQRQNLISNEFSSQKRYNLLYNEISCQTNTEYDIQWFLLSDKSRFWYQVSYLVRQRQNLISNGFFCQKMTKSDIQWNLLSDKDKIWYPVSYLTRKRQNLISNEFSCQTNT